MPLIESLSLIGWLFSRHTRLSIMPKTKTTRLALALLVCLFALAAAGQTPDPKPDPAGVATGDKTSVQDAGGNSFVVAEPTDKTAPDYAQKKKDFDNYQALAAKEPLAGKLADSVGHLRIGTNFAWTLN